MLMSHCHCFNVCWGTLFLIKWFLEEGADSIDFFNGAQEKEEFDNLTSYFQIYCQKKTHLLNSIIFNDFVLEVTAKLLNVNFMLEQSVPK